MARHTSELVSRNPLEATRAHHRLDPYWDGLWSNGSTASWWSRNGALRAVQAGMVNPTERNVPMDRDEAFAAMLAVRPRGRRLRLLAAANLWRTMTVEQAGAFTGKEYSAKSIPNDMYTMWSAGLLETGRVKTFGPNRFPKLIRPSAVGKWDSLYDLLTFDEWIGVTAGQKWRWGTQADRHNVLATEVGLRAAEFLDTPVVLGEQLALLEALRPPGVVISQYASRRGADAMVVRPDGLRIMIEMTTSTVNIDAKVQRWADTLAQDVDRTMAVVFVTATHPDFVDSPRAHDRADLQGAIRKAVTSSMNHVLAGVEKRMSVVRYSDWFPASQMVDDRFLSLWARRSTGHTGDSWQDVSLMDPFDMEGPNPSSPGLLDIVSNAPYLYGLPTWMRERPELSATQLWATSVGVVDFPRLEGMPPTPQQRQAARAGTTGS